MSGSFFHFFEHKSHSFFMRAICSLKTYITLLALSANRSFKKRDKNESLSVLFNKRAIRSFLSKNRWFAQKTKEQIPNPVLKGQSNRFSTSSFCPHYCLWNKNVWEERHKESATSNSNHNSYSICLICIVLTGNPMQQPYRIHCKSYIQLESNPGPFRALASQKFGECYSWRVSYQLCGVLKGQSNRFFYLQFLSSIQPTWCPCISPGSLSSCW